MKNDLIDRSKQFALNSLSFARWKHKSFENDILYKQLIRSSTSVAANYRSAQRARSKAEFRSKIFIVVEECDEALFWLEMLLEGGFVERMEIQGLMTEATELLKIFNSIKSKVKGK